MVTDQISCLESDPGFVFAFSRLQVDATEIEDKQRDVHNYKSEKVLSS
jgi:hypothetical protein